MEIVWAKPVQTYQYYQLLVKYHKTTVHLVLTLVHEKLQPL